MNILVLSIVLWQCHIKIFIRKKWPFFLMFVWYFLLPKITRLSVSDEKKRVGEKRLPQGEASRSTELGRRVGREGLLNQLRTSASRCVIYSPS